MNGTIFSSLVSSLINAIKRTFFLQNPEARATSHNDNVAEEKALFIDPASDNPEHYISFRAEIPYAIDIIIVVRLLLQHWGWTANH